MIKQREELKKVLEEAQQLRDMSKKLIDRSEAIQRMINERKNTRKKPNSA